MKRFLLLFISLFFLYNTTNAGYSITNIPTDTYSQNIGGNDYIEINNLGIGIGDYGYYSKVYMAGLYNINGSPCAVDEGTHFYINELEPFTIKGCLEGNLVTSFPVKIVRTTDSATVYANDFDIMLNPNPPTPPVASTGTLTNSINNLTNNFINTTTLLTSGPTGLLIATTLALIILTFIVLYVRGFFNK